MNGIRGAHRLAHSRQLKLRTLNYQSATSGNSLRRFHSSSLAFLGDIHLYDTLSEGIRSLPETDKGLAWYTCGPTTYAPAHLGHARTYVSIDILRRVVEDQSTKAPLFVMNITDIDDKILAAAKESGMSPSELARKYENEFWEDMDSLNCLRPHVVTRVSERVESDIIPYIDNLLQKRIAYQAEDGVYFDIKAFDEQMGNLTRYGKLAPPAASKDLDLEFGEMKKNAKKDRRDFALWKKQKSGELISWNAPWGHGRPGWHIECSAMIEAVQKQFEDTHRFLIHAGGVDLKFPHHTNEIAQAEAYRGESDWIAHWVHTGHVHIDGLKMSKSLKNFISIREFLGGRSLESPLESPGDDFRLWCLGLSGSYRAPTSFSEKQLLDARAARRKIIGFLQAGEMWVSGVSHTNSKMWTVKETSLFKLSEEVRNNSRLALRNDLHGANFVKEIMKIVEHGNKYLSMVQEGPTEPMTATLRTVRELLRLVGFSKKTTEIGLKIQDSESGSINGDNAALIDELVSFRSKVRNLALKILSDRPSDDQTSKFLRLCDEVRASVQLNGVEIIDNKNADENGWRFCLPDSAEKAGKKANKQKSTSVDIMSVPVYDLFRVGIYEGQFAEFSDDGMPTLNADGSEISKRALKKLKKKREAHIKRLQGSS